MNEANLFNSIRATCKSARARDVHDWKWNTRFVEIVIRLLKMKKYLLGLLSGC